MASQTSTAIKWDKREVEAIQYRFTRGLVAMGFDTANRARFKAPYRTGALRNSIRVNELNKSVEVLAGGDVFGKSVPYALAHELGGKTGRNHSINIRAKHYMRDALRETLRSDYAKYFKGVA